MCETFTRDGRASALGYRVNIFTPLVMQMCRERTLINLNQYPTRLTLVGVTDIDSVVALCGMRHNGVRYKHGRKHHNDRLDEYIFHFSLS